MKSKVMNFIKEDVGFIFIHFGLLILVLLIATTLFMDDDYKLQLPGENLFANITYGVTLIMGIIYFFVFTCFENKKIKLEYLYLALVIPLGIMYCIANPFGKIPDEDEHSKKAYVISCGNFFLRRTKKEILHIILMLKHWALCKEI